MFLGKILYSHNALPPLPDVKLGGAQGEETLQWLKSGRQWLPHTWKPHVITVVHLLNSPVLIARLIPANNTVSVTMYTPT